MVVAVAERIICELPLLGLERGHDFTIFSIKKKKYNELNKNIALCSIIH